MEKELGGRIPLIVNGGACSEGLESTIISIEPREGKKPIMSDLKGSGGLEEKAKAIMLLHRPAAYDDGTSLEIPDENLIQVLVVKNSNGMTGEIDLRWEPERMRIS